MGHLHGVLTSSRRNLWRRHLGSKMAAREMTSTKTWGAFFDPHCGGGGKWLLFRFRPPSWKTSFAEPEMRSSKMAAGSGRAAIFLHLHNGDRKTRPILLTASPVQKKAITHSEAGLYLTNLEYWYIEYTVSANTRIQSIHCYSERQPTLHPRGEVKYAWWKWIMI